MSLIFNELNQEQRAAVEQVDGSLLILAGAGSGKTKTITSRLAYLIDKVGIPAENTLTLTFTNRAATEMRERALKMIKRETYPPLLCTFHKFGLLFLKLHIEELNRNNNFNIIDTEDKKRIIKQFGIELPPSLIANEISHYKNSLIEPYEAVVQTELKNDKLIADAYERYEIYLAENNLVDFDDLLKLPYKILEQNEELCRETSEKYRYIMIDEYQDTNELQFRLLKQLCSTHNNLCVVGDDDQSIYGWRGANIKNILEFEQNFKDTTLIKLEKNYRSTEQILKAANSLIAHNRSRLGKNLEATMGSGKKVTIVESSDEKEEIEKISKLIAKSFQKGVSPKEIAILYRINALSRSLEDGLSRAGIGYQLVGGLRFYDRAEIKDIISYLRLLVNKNDDFSLKRIINKPRRGIGKVTINKIENGARARGVALHSYIQNSSVEELELLVGKKNSKTLKKFIDQINDATIASKAEPYAIPEKIEELFEIKTAYALFADGVDRIINIDEFYGYLRDYVKQNPVDPLEEFLSDIALQGNQDQMTGQNISIMSIHASKGLEFEHLFVIGLEEKFLPMTAEGTNLEEERRLGYVAMTRAKKELTLSHVHSRFYKGRREELKKSRFLKEAALIKGSLSLEQSSSFKKGDLVRHKIFGNGRILGVGRVGKDFKLNINFSGNRREILSSFVEKI